MNKHVTINGTELSAKDVLQAAKRISMEFFEGRVRVESSESIKPFINNRFAGNAHESIAVAYIDDNGYLISFEEEFRGTLGQVPVYPRRLLKKALDLGALKCIIVHHYPGTVPDRKDRKFDTDTRERLTKALELLDIKLLDYLCTAEGLEYPISHLD